MDTQIVTLVGITSAFLGGLLGYGIKYYFDKKHYFITKNAEYKREAYSELISLLLRVQSNDKLGDLENKDLVQRLNSAYEKCILFASPDVINSFGDVMQLMFMNKEGDSSKEFTQRLFSGMTKIYILMREDIGLKNDGLGENGIKLMRVKISDYSDYFDESVKEYNEN